MFGKENGFGKYLWAFTVLFVVASLIATGFVGAVNTQATRIVPSASEKISSKIEEYKAANPDYKERLVTPLESLSWWGTLCGIIAAIAFALAAVCPPAAIVGVVCTAISLYDSASEWHGSYNPLDWGWAWDSWGSSSSNSYSCDYSYSYSYDYSYDYSGDWY